MRPGDVIESYDGRRFDGIKDLLMASITKDDVNRIAGYKIDYLSGQRSNFDYTLKTYQNPAAAREQLLTIGVMTPAQYFIYEEPKQLFETGLAHVWERNQAERPALMGRWRDDFFLNQLKSLINESTDFLTVHRGDQIFQTQSSPHPYRRSKDDAGQGGRA